LGSVKILLIGCGYWGKNWYNTILKSDYELVGVVDPKPVIDVKVPLFDDVLDVNIDYTHTIVSVPPRNVLEVFGKLNITADNVLIEKPCGVSYNDILKLGNIYPGLIFMNSPQYKYIKDNMEQIGKPLFFDSRRASMGPRIRDDVSILEDYLIHDLCIFMGLFGSDVDVLNVLMTDFFDDPIKKDSIWLNVESNTADHYVLGSMFSSWRFPKKIRELVIVGTEGSFIWEDEKLSINKSNYSKIDGIDDFGNIDNKLNLNESDTRILLPSKSNLELELDDFITGNKISINLVDVWKIISTIKQEVK
jgi:predicted dehydrogenase|tara:strand:- start:969 stop:1883 length:915 start_codon:yes stop_codon:yes gene_type:complete